MRLRKSRFRNARPTLTRVLLRKQLVLVLISVGTTGVLLTLVALFGLRDYANHNLELTARSISHTIDTAIVFDENTIRETLTTVYNEEVLDARILDKTVTYWSSEAWSLEQIIAQWMLDPVTLPITHKGKQVGQVCLRGNGRSLFYFLISAFICMIAGVMISLLCALLITRRMIFGIANSLNHITNVARAVRRDRTFNLRVLATPIGELYKLCTEFNSLLEALETWLAHLQKENASLTHSATHDCLTGLPNRAFFEGRLSRALGNIASSEKLAVLFMDGDKFKEVNDSYGHAAGDTVLVTIAGRIRAQLRESDLVARLGGDEFAAILSHVHSSEDVLQIADNIIDCMKQPVVLSNGKIIVPSVSIGIALYPDHAVTPEGLLHEADGAMYKVKRKCHFDQDFPGGETGYSRSRSQRPTRISRANKSIDRRRKIMIAAPSTISSTRL